MQRIVLTNAHVIDCDEGARGPAVITIAGDRIESVTVGRPQAAPAEALVFDLKGRSVMPGMFTCHYHGSYPGALGWKNLPIGMESPPALQALQASYNMNLALQCGFTGVVGAGAPYGIDASLKIAIEQGIITGPRIMAGSRDISTTGHAADLFYPWHWEGRAPSVVSCDGADAFRRAVREEVKRGAEIIKVFATSGHGVPGQLGQVDLTLDEFRTIVETAHQRGAKVRAHLANRDGIMMALDAGVDMVDHGDGLDEECVERMAAGGVFLAPSMLYSKRVTERREGFFAETMQASLDNMLKILPVANRAGVKLVLGDDFGSWALEHGEYANELEYYVHEAGIPAIDVLRWATRNGAELMGLGHELGALKAGALADLIVVDGDPLADIRILKDRDKLLAIIKGGVFAKNDLDTVGSETSI